MFTFCHQCDPLAQGTKETHVCKDALEAINGILAEL